MMTKILWGILPSLCYSFTCIYVTTKILNLTLLFPLFLILLFPTPCLLPEMRGLSLLLHVDAFL